MAQSIHSNSNASSRSAYSTDIRSSALVHPLPIGEYLFRRIYELGIRAVHGVSGDHNLAALDYLEHCGLNWVGNCNELNAGYAADGYARVKGIAALVTTFGVGELSALNAIAGAYAEYVPIIHIVGTPPTYSQQNGMLYHTLGNGNYNTFSEMSRSLSCAVVSLNDAAEASARIDHAIRECWIQSRPVYIALPVDMVGQQVEGHRLQTPIDLSYPPNDPDREDYVVDVVLRYMHAARNPIILVDACAIRHRAVLETHNLAERSGLPTFVSPMAKGAVNEDLPNYCGVYAGDGSDDDIRERVETADLVLHIGGMKLDFTTTGFTYRITELSTIDFYSNLARIKYSEYPNLRMNGVLKKLTDKIGTLSIVPGPNPQNAIPFLKRDNREELTHTWFWRHMARWLQPNDIVITEIGNANGIWETRFPPNVTAINQILWNSTGYTTPACLGAALAAQELMTARPGRRARTILFTGENSFQFTAQEMSVIIRRKLNPIIFIICNHNQDNAPQRTESPISPSHQHYEPHQQAWRYKDLIPAFGAPRGSYQSCSVHTRKQVQALFADKSFNEAACLQFVELHMGREKGGDAASTDSSSRRSFPPGLRGPGAAGPAAMTSPTTSSGPSRPPSARNYSSNMAYRDRRPGSASTQYTQHSTR
ncbi:pyruvate decarboxylase [Lecanosticta acicola]|uniref:Pyruvate decarboxylase n=1 Tax=Lecanosticta acicola TaxID=111012 RepID=A0AAI8YXS0_9PEZI|nr:pyruvate decarboxylase [Lecanosticta acicola]